MPGAPILPAGQTLPLSNDSSVATSDLVQIFQTTGVAAEVQALVTAKGIVSVANFANSCDSKAEVSEKYLAGTDLSQNLLQIASLKQAWREAEKRTEQRLSKSPPDVTSLEHRESALPHAMQEELGTSFLRRYSWLRAGSKMIGCDSLLGRVRPEFDRKAPNVFKVSKVRTRAQSSLADPCKRRRLSQHVSMTLVSELQEENGNLWNHGLLCQAARSGSDLGCGREQNRALERL